MVLTADTAAAYVTGIETSWGLIPSIVGIELTCHDEVPCVDIRTADNTWSVWLETDGTLYGEC